MPRLRRPIPRDARAVRRGGWRLRTILGLALLAGSPVLPAAEVPELSLEQLLDVSIVGASKYSQRQTEVAAAASVITRREIRAFGWRTLDEALNSLPGIHIAYDRQYSYLGTRGFGLPGDFNTRVLVTIDGNRINDPTYDGGPLGRMFPLDLDLVERIELVPGPGGAVYGQNAMFGVINVVTRRGEDVGGAELGLAAQHPQRLREGRASWGGTVGGGVDLLLSATAMRARGEDRFIDFGAAGVAGVAAGLDGERDREVFARIGRGPWSASWLHADRRKDDPTGAYFSDPLVPGQYQSDGYTIGQLSYQDRFDDDRLAVSARFFAGQHRFRSTLVYGSRYEFPADSRWRGLEFQLLSTAWTDHKLMLGLEAQESPSIEQSILDISDPSQDVHIVGQGHRFGVFVQDEWRLGPAFTATLGLRVDRNSLTGRHLSPRAALIWRADARTTWKLLFGRAHRAPNAYERDYDDGVAVVANPALRGERIETVEVVADHRVDRDLLLRASAYGWTMTDLVTLGTDPVSGLSQYQSGAPVKARGAEFSADRTWGAGIRLRGSVSVQRVADTLGQRLLNSPRLLGKMQLSAPWPSTSWRLGLEWRAMSRRLTNDGSDVAGHALTHLHLSNDQLWPGLDLSLRIENLFGRRYADPGADSSWQNSIEQDGRAVRLKLGYAF